MVRVWACARVGQRDSLLMSTSVERKSVRKLKLTLAPDALAALVPGSRVIEVPESWFNTLEQSASVFEQFYLWLMKQGCVAGELHQRARVGGQLQRRLLRAEKKRLQKKHHISGEKLDKALWWSDANAGPMESFAERMLTGSAVCVLPPDRTGVEQELASRLLDEQIELNIQHANKLRAAMSGSNFYYWITGARDHDDRIGDIARDIFQDSSFPKEATTYQEIERYMISWCEAAVECLEDAWIEYTERYPERVAPTLWCEQCEKEIKVDGSIVYDGSFSITHEICENDPERVLARLPVVEIFRRGLQAFCVFAEEHSGGYSKTLEKKLRIWGFHKNSTEKSSIYFIQIGLSGPIKIGYTAGSVDKRLASLQTSHPEPLRVLASIEGNRDVETDLHARFARYRKKGEWFEPHPDIIQFFSTDPRREKMTYIDDIFGATGLLAQRFDGYSPRPGQVDMVRLVDAAIRDRGHALIEAPTGTGKSLAYAVPAIYHITHLQSRTSPPPPPMPDDFDEEFEDDEIDEENTRSRAVIVTANIALQEQLVKKDLPFLKEVLPWSFSFSLLKGMSNYLCRNKLVEDEGRTHQADSTLDAKIRAWAEETKTGDKSELPFDPPARLWSHFSVSSDECGGKDCTFFKQCFPKIQSAKAKEADVIVTNYALFFLDLLIKTKSLGNAYIIPPYSIAILDEGHKAVDIARDFFGWRVTEGAIDWAAGMLPTDDKIAVHKAQSMFFFALKNYRRSREYKARIKKPDVVDSTSLVEQLGRAVKIYKEILGECSDENEAMLNSEQRKARKKMKRRCVRCEQLCNNIKKAMQLYAPPEAPWVKHPTMAPGSTPYTRWYHSNPAQGGDNSVKNEAQIRALSPNIEDIYFIEEDRERVVLSSMPVSVASMLRDVLFRTTDSITVTSATLAASGSFDFIRDDLGIVEESKPPVKTLVAESPFAWREQALLVLPQDIPDPNAPNFVNVIVERLTETLNLARGRTLALFTSNKNMNAAYERLKGGPWRILKQGDMPRIHLIDEFRKDVSSVLLGVESFWAGVDVQGESLSCVFIDRLPFATPDDPLLDALAERDKRGWFMKFSVPQAIIAFKQGFGRLIRTTSDKGVVVVCDRRITMKPYGQMFLQSLPPVQQSFDLKDVQRFLDGEALGGLRRAPTGRSLFESLNNE